MADPVDYQRLWFDRKTGAVLDGSVWRPIPPPGYVALGDVWMSGWDVKPPRNAIWCVKKDAVGGHTYVRRGELREQVWNDRGTGGNAGDVAIWRVDVPPIDEDPSLWLLIAPNTVSTVTHYQTPAPTDTTWILDVPAEVEEHPEPSPPLLTSHQEPPSSRPVVNRIVRVPFTGVKDEGRTLEWKVENSPFYRLHRRVGYDVAIFTNNEHGDSPAPAGEEVITGVSSEESELFYEKTTIMVAASVGISFKGLGAEAGVNVTRELGYERRTSVADLNLTKKDQRMSTRPGVSQVMWVKTHEVLAYRGADGDNSLVAEGLPFRVPHYALVSYPRDAVGEHIEPAGVPEQEFQQAPDIDWDNGGGIPGFDGEAMAKKLEALKREAQKQPQPASE
ncbi:Vps62-related protein [Saccharopolyspora shandongensis]|uniref:Vps62-related protein n=1 Tax=Saccharopolyspora shandongensis TaxID=418495 RepID=UPI0033E9AF06